MTSQKSPPVRTAFPHPDLRDLRLDNVIALRALDAQAALLPYALLLFGIALPVFLWAASFATNAVWALASLAIFAVNWGAFYAVVVAVRREPALALDVRRRGRINIMAGLLWSVAIAQISLFAMGAGPAREALLLLAAGASVICIFFNAASLPGLLIVGSTAAAGPLVGLYLSTDTRTQAGLVWGGVALATALSLIVNRLLMRQFALTSEREKLTEARSESLLRSERLAKSKADLISTLGHEIRTGLTGVVHVLEAAAAGGRTGPSREQLSAALTAARDVMGVLNATLDSEQADAGGLVLRTTPFEAASLARDLAALHRPLATSKGLQLFVHVDPELDGLDAGAVLADPSRVRQVVASLLVNAVSYTLRGRIELRLRKLDDERVRFEVADTGPGLTADELEHAFEPFGRIDRTSAGSSGAGLGLSLARRLAALMGGEVTADSAVGVGSCFYLDLPYDAQTAPTDATESAAEPMDSSSRGLRILLADGDGLNAAMTRAALEQLGHQVVQTQKVERLPELLRICEVDVIIVGGFGADGSPSETVHQVKAMSKAQIVGVIDGEAAEAAECREAGADLVVRKPVTVAALARALSSLQKSEAPRPRAVA